MANQPLKLPLASLNDHSTLQLTTLGRKTGKRHTVPVWFVVEGDTVYLGTLKLKRDWPRNAKKNGYVEIKIGETTLTGHATQITNPKQLDHVNALLVQKYWAAWLGSWFGMRPEGTFLVTIEG